MNCKCLILSAIGAAALLCAAAPGFATSILGSAENFAVLAGTPDITNTGTTTITGDVGIAPAAAITGQGPGADQIILTGAYHQADAVALTAKNDLSTAYTALNNMPVPLGNTLGNQLGGLTLTSGVYNFSGNPAAVLLDGTLTLNAEGNNNAYWVFQIPFGLTAGSTLTASVVVSNLGSNGGKDDGVFFVVGSLADLYASTSFEGNILAGASITLKDSATIINGRALAQTADVTMIHNTIENVCPNGGPGYSGGLEYDTNGNIVPVGPSQGPGAIPEPVTLSGLVLAVGSLCGYVRRRARR